MASPFSIFRRHQQALMVVLVILAMLAFTMDDFLRSGGFHPAVLGAILGGAIFSIAGIGRGRWMHYGAAGVLLGGIGGMVLPGLIGPDVAGTTTSTLGDYTPTKKQELAAKELVANQFLAKAIAEALPGDDEEARRTRMQLQNGYGFGFNPQSREASVMFAEMLRAEADKIGIVVTNEMVTSYLNEATQQKLSREGFANARKNLVVMTSDRDDAAGTPVSEEMLYDILRDQLRARMAYSVINPMAARGNQIFALPVSATPDTLFGIYCRTNVTQKLNLTEIDVDSFLDQVGEPTEAEIVALFDENKSRSTHQLEPGSPGFFQSPKVKLAYIELDEKTVESSVPAVTDDEVSEYYEQNKDVRFRRMVMPETEGNAPATPGTNAPANADPGTEPVEPAGDQPPAEGTPATEGGVPAAEGTPAAPVTPEAGTPPADPPTPEPAAESPAVPDVDASTPAADPEPAAENPAGEECNPFADESQSPAAIEEAAAVEPAAITTQETPPTLEASTEPAAVTEPQAPPAEDGAATADPPATDPPATDPPATDPPAPALSIPADPPAVPQTTESTAGGDETAEPQYVPLDDDLKSQIRDQLLRARIATLVDDRMSKIVEDMTQLEESRKAHRFQLVDQLGRNADDEALQTALKKYSQTMLDGLEKVAADAGCKVQVTGFLSPSELADEEKYPIGNAAPPAESMMQSGGPSVYQTAFAGYSGGTFSSTALFISRRASTNPFEFDLDATQSARHFAWWLVDTADPHEPTLDEEGVRDEVVLAWKRIKARELARKRADEIAEMVRQGLSKPEAERQPMATTLEGVKATGEVPLVVRSTRPFSWLQQQRNQQNNFMQAPQVSFTQIEYADAPGKYLEMSGNNFRSAVFEKLADGDVGVVPAEDLSALFVVQVVDRTPSEDIAVEALRQRFVGEAGGPLGFFMSPVRSIVESDVAGELSGQWQRDLWKKYQIDTTTFTN